MSKKKQTRRKKTAHKGWAWLVVAVVVAGAGYYWFAAGSGPVPGADFRDTEVVTRGEALYRTHCAACHGQQARGENPATPMGGTKVGGGYIAPALNGTGHAWHHAPDALFDVIRNGSPAQDSTMRGWAGKLSDQEISDVMAYFRSLWPELIQARYSRMFRD